MEVLGVCFDFDGVIVDSMPYHLEAWRRAHLHVFQEKIPEDFINSLVGYSTKAIAAKICGLHHKEAAATRLVKAKLIELNRSPGELAIFPGFFEFVQLLQDQRTPWVVISNSPRAYIENVFQHHQLPTSVIRGVEDFKRPKPAPDPYLKAIRDFGIPFIKNKNVLIFEDSTHGISAGVGARATVVGITSSHEPKELESAGASKCYKNLKDFLQSSYCKTLKFSAED